MEEAAAKPSEDEIKFDETEHRREDAWFLALDAENATMKNACPYQNRFGEK